MERAEIVRQYCQKWQDTPTLTLAKKIYKEHPKLFKDLEAARASVRYIRGNSGDTLRENTKDKTLFRPAGSVNPFELPKSYSKPRVPVNIDGTRILMLYDTHIPYHDARALEVAIDYGIKNNADTVVLGGDIIDFHLVSNYIKDPEARKMSEELQSLKSFLGLLRSVFPKARIYYKEGNHEERYWKYMRVKAPELLDIQAMSVTSLLGLDQYSIEWIDGRTKANIGKLSVFHGHEFGRTVFSPVNVARGLYLRAKASSICGHSHQTSQHPERDVNGKIIICWSVGGLCDLSPDYSPYNKWNHGFAFVETNGREFSVRNFSIHEGKIL